MTPDILYPRKVVAVTPNDSTAVDFVGLYIGIGGDVSLRPAADTSGSVLFKNVPSGSFLPIQTNLVLSTATTATNILGLRIGRS